MSRHSQVFVGRLPLDSNERDIEDLFGKYGRISRMNLKFGTGMAYAFVDYEDKRDAEDAIKYENGRDMRGQTIVVEWARGPSRGPTMRSRGSAECYRCHRPGHWARDCPELERDRYRARRYSRSGSRDRRGGGRRYSNSRSRSPSRGRFGRGGYGRRRTPSQVRSPSYNRSRRPKKQSPTGSGSRSRSGSMNKRRGGEKSLSHSPQRNRSGSPPAKRPSHSRSRSRSVDQKRSMSRSLSPKRAVEANGGRHSRSRSRSRSFPRVDARADDRSPSPA